MIFGTWNAWSMVLAAGLAYITSSNAPAAPSAPKIDASPFLGDHYPPRRIEFPDGVISFADVAYAMIPGFRPLTLDVYLAPKRGPTVGSSPLVLYIHGGG